MIKVKCEIHIASAINTRKLQYSDIPLDDKDSDKRVEGH